MVIRQNSHVALQNFLGKKSLMLEKRKRSTDRNKFRKKTKQGEVTV